MWLKVGQSYANKESFHRAIQDFEEALAANPRHNNARNYLLETLLTYGKSCEDDREFEEACVHYQHALKVDPGNVEAKDMLAGCQRLMVIQKQQEGSKPGAEVEKEKTIDVDVDVGQSLISRTAEKLKQLIQEDRKKSSSSAKKKTKKRWSSSSSSSDSGHSGLRKPQHRRSRSSSSSGSDRRHRRKSRKVSGDSDRSSRKKGKRRRRSVTTSPPPRKPDVKEEHGERTLTREKSPVEDRRTKDSLMVKTEGGAETEGFSFEIEPKVTTSFLPVSSRDYFSTTTRIPGLGSPENADERPPPVKRSPQHRTAQLLMTERRKFYEDNARPPQHTFRGVSSSLATGQRRSRTRSPQGSRSRSAKRSLSRSPQRSMARSRSAKRSPSRSRSRSGKRSPSRSPQRPRSRSAKRSPSRSPQRPLLGARARRSRSKSPREGTGLKELDMYLGNVRPSKDKDSQDILSAWESFIRHKEKPSPPPARRSRSDSRDSVGSRSPYSSPRPRYRSRSLSRSPAAPPLSFRQDYGDSWRGERREGDPGWRERVYNEWGGRRGGRRGGGLWSGRGGYRSPGRERVVPRDRDRGRLSRSPPPPPVSSVAANRFDHQFPSRGGYGRGRMGRLQDRPGRPKTFEESPRGIDGSETGRDKSVFVEADSRPSFSQGLVDRQMSQEQFLRWRERQEKYEATVSLNLDERREGIRADQQRRSQDVGEEGKRVRGEELWGGREEKAGKEERAGREERSGREERVGREGGPGREERRSLKDAWTSIHKGRSGDREPSDLAEDRVRLEGQYATSKNPDGGQREREKVKDQGREERDGSSLSSRKLEDGYAYGGPREESGRRFQEERERSRESSASQKFAVEWRQQRERSRESSASQKFVVDSRQQMEEVGVSGGGTSAVEDEVKPSRRRQEVDEEGGGSGKLGTGGAGPRIIRKPVMDDPNLNRPMLSSNELAVLERKKREEKERLRQKYAETKPDTAQDGSENFKGGESKRASKDRRGEEEESDGKTRRTDRKKKKRRKSRDKDKKRRRRDSSDAGDDEEEKKKKKNGENDKKKLKIEASKSRGMPDDDRGDGKGRKGSDDASEGGEKGRKSQWLDEVDLEKEIERRVQQRLREEEARLKEVALASQGQQEAVGHEQGATDVPETATDGESSDTLAAAAQEAQKASRWDSKRRASGQNSVDVRDLGGDKSEKKGESEEEQERDRIGESEGKQEGEEKGENEGKGESEEEEEDNHPEVFIETQSGWCKDMKGNMYYARKWEELAVGWHEDKHGNKYFAHAMDRESYQEAIEGLREEMSEREREREAWRSRARGRGYGRGRGRGFFHGYGARGRFEFNRRSRSPKKSRSRSPKRSRSHREKRSRSRHRRNSSPSSVSDSLKPRGSPRSRRSKDGRSKSSDKKKAEKISAVADKSVKAADHQKSAEPSGRTGSGGPEVADPPVADREDETGVQEEETEVTFVVGTRGDNKLFATADLREASREQTDDWDDVENENWREKVPLKSALKVTPASRWDRMPGVGESGGHSRWADDASVGLETDEVGGKTSEESLTELEKFLRNLKQMKKKQWIAEGKVKEKE
ncbi:zinc finger CCCH domain-containing protein 13 isoform X2 [Aplysia californica]|uniref:Zinc finger CCCH domain-containing protein 13 isoform X2 n=1 Tax=Aplysia californica TaxID=6500 RepID=A0ABM1A7D0_APLCA|nr:zinc finger CCCH domain-containing protein 13 isoform X2 [Aplysia californica]